MLQHENTSTEIKTRAGTVQRKVKNLLLRIYLRDKNVQCLVLIALRVRSQYKVKVELLRKYVVKYCLTCQKFALTAVKEQLAKDVRKYIYTAKLTFAEIQGATAAFPKY